MGPQVAFTSTSQNSLEEFPEQIHEMNEHRQIYPDRQGFAIFEENNNYKH